MLDTVTVTLNAPLRVRLPIGVKIPARNGLKLWTDTTGKVLKKIEINVPKVLFDHNGRIIESQAQIDAALEKYRTLLEPIAMIPPVSEWEPNRVDIVWNFDLPAQALIIAFATIRFPGILRGATLFDGGQGVSWRGAKSQKIVTFYNKSRHMRVPGSTLRAEISLRGTQLHRYLQGASWRSFKHLYEVYRSFLISMPSINSSFKADSFAAAIGLEAPEIRNRILSRLSHKPERTFRRYREQVEAAATLRESPFSWADILPQNTPPPAIHVEPARWSKQP